MHVAMETHFPNHISPTTYSPAAVTGRLRSLDQPEEAKLSSEGAGQANGSTKNPRWAGSRATIHLQPPPRTPQKCQETSCLSSSRSLPASAHLPHTAHTPPGCK